MTLLTLPFSCSFCNLHMYVCTGSFLCMVRKLLLISPKIWMPLTSWCYWGLTRCGPFDNTCHLSIWVTSLGQEVTDTHILGAMSNNFRTIHKKDPVNINLSAAASCEWASVCSAHHLFDYVLQIYSFNLQTIREQCNAMEKQVNHDSWCIREWVKWGWYFRTYRLHIIMACENARSSDTEVYLELQWSSLLTHLWICFGNGGEVFSCN